MNNQGLKMIIKSVLLDRNRYKLVSSDYCNENNAFTIIVGSNGAGKSRLLKRIVNNIKNLNNEGDRIPQNYSRQLYADNDGNDVTFFSSSSESKSFIGKDKKNIISIDNNLKVIAVTTTPFDKFPVEYKGNSIYRYHDNDRYTYIGLKVSKNSLNQSNFLNLLSRAMLSNDRIFSETKLFTLLKLRAKAYIQFKAKLPTKYSDLLKYDQKSHDWVQQEFTKNLFIDFIFNHHSTIYYNIYEDNKLITKAYNYYIKCFSFLSEEINPESCDVPKEELKFLLDIGLINVSDIIFSDLEDGRVKISDLSSGQKCMVLTVLNIAGAITNNCIVCIDEPEISLHPRWQKEFMKVLIKFFSGYKKCHFIIATHSPLIISELSNANCFILNMDIGSAEAAVEYKNMSSDYQLAEIFGIAGNNNEYLNRLVVSLLSKLSINGTLNKAEQTKLKALIYFSNEMDETDTVKELIDILRLAWIKVSANA